MATIAKTLDALMKKRKVSQYALAEATGVPQPTIQRILAGVSKDPKTATLDPLAKFFDLSTAELRQGAKKSDSNVRVVQLFPSVPVISWVQAGNLKDIEIHLHPGEGDRWEGPREKKLGPRGFALVVDGDSMDDGTDAGIPEGYIIFVDPDLAPFPNAFVIAKDVQTQKATFKKLTTDGGRWYLTPLNKQYQAIPIDKPELRVIGVVTEAQAPARKLV